MDYNSEEESDISESEIEEYSDKPYKELKDGNHKVKNLNGTLRCPYCAGKKKKEFKYKDLMQHATGVSKGSANRNAKQKANHLALAKFLETDLVNEADQIPPPALVEAVNHPVPQVENYVWPWTGIIVNIKSNLNDSGYWLKEFAKYRPLDVHVFFMDGDTQAVVDFINDWNGFKNASEFERSFETKHHGKKEWNSMDMQASSDIYGWVAREDDYNCGGPIGEYLRNKGRLRTISDFLKEPSERENRKSENLANEIDITNENLYKMQYKYNERIMSISRMLEEKDRLHNAFVEESRSMRRKAHEEVRRILEEQEKLRNELDEKMRKLDTWSRDLNKREVLTDQERQKLEEDKKKKDSRNELLLLASKEQKIADENVFRLIEEQKREKEEALNKILQLEKQLDAKQKLEMEIEELKGKLQVMKHLGDQDDEAIKKKMEEMSTELEESLEDMKSMNQILIDKECQSNDELQEARKELINGLNEMLKGNNKTNIGTKRMGDLNAEGYAEFELWNFKEQRKATLKEVITYIVEHMKQLKRKRG